MVITVFDEIVSRINWTSLPSILRTVRRQSNIRHVRPTQQEREEKPIVTYAVVKKFNCIAHLIQ